MADHHVRIISVDVHKLLNQRVWLVVPAKVPAQAGDIVFWTLECIGAGSLTTATVSQLSPGAFDKTQLDLSCSDPTDHATILQGASLGDHDYQVIVHDEHQGDIGAPGGDGSEPTIIVE